MAKTATTSTQAFAETQVPSPVPPTRWSLGAEDTLYAPTQVSVEAGAFIDDACPMYYEINSTMTWIVLGDTNTLVNLQLSDRALINLATMANRAAHALLHERGKAIPGTDSDAA